MALALAASSEEVHRRYKGEEDVDAQADEDLADLFEHVGRPVGLGGDRRCGRVSRSSKL